MVLNRVIYRMSKGMTLSVSSFFYPNFLVCVFYSAFLRDEAFKLLKQNITGNEVFLDKKKTPS